MSASWWPDMPLARVEIQADEVLQEIAEAGLLSMDGPRCYLAGPIAGQTYERANDWRIAAGLQLRSHGIEPLSPMRGKENLEGQVIGSEGYDDYLVTTAQGFTTRDFSDIRRSSAVLMNLLPAGSGRTSIGSMIEVGYTHALGIPLIVDEENIHYHAMLRATADVVTASLDEAVIYVIDLLGTGV